MLTVIRYPQPRFRMPTAGAWMACLALAVLPTQASAQEGSRVWPSLDTSGLPTVYVREHTGIETAGRLLSIDPASLVILADGAERRFEAGQVRQIDRRGDSLRNGALIGATIGMVLGALAAGVSDCPDPRPGGGCPGTRVAMFATSTAVWTSIGTAIDAAIPGRTTIYVATSPRRLSVTAAVSRSAAGLQVGW